MSRAAKCLGSPGPEGAVGKLVGSAFFLIEAGNLPFQQLGDEGQRSGCFTIVPIFVAAMRHATKITDETNTCAICQAERRLTFHHLIPRRCHTNKWFRKNFSKEDMRTRGIAVCRGCHTFIHRQFSEKQLGREYNTLDKLLAAEVVANYAKWARSRHQ